MKLQFLIMPLLNGHMVNKQLVMGGESMNKKPTISIIIPALNEEGNIENTVNTVKIALQDRFRDNEFLSLMTEVPIKQGL